MAFKFTDMVFKVTEWSDARFTYIEKHTLNALAQRADEEGKCFPGFTCLCSDTGLSRSRISLAINNLKELGLLEIEIGFRGAYRYALKEEEIIQFGGLDVENEEDKPEPKRKRVKGRDGKYYYRATPEEQAAEIKELKDKEHEPGYPPCDVCGKAWLDCSCDEFLPESMGRAAPEKQFHFACPQCGLKGYGTQAILDTHIQKSHNAKCEVCNKLKPECGCFADYEPKQKPTRPVPSTTTTPCSKCAQTRPACKCWTTNCNRCGKATIFCQCSAPSIEKPKAKTTTTTWPSEDYDPEPDECFERKYEEMLVQRESSY